MTATTTATTRSESDVYDRQIRLWGAEAQAKMSQAKVLYINITGVSSEILKNLVLAGIRPSICDVRKVGENESFLKQTPSFFWAPFLDEDSDNGGGKRLKRDADTTIAQLVQPSIEELNPLLGDCELVTNPISELTEELLKSYSVIVASHVLPSEIMALKAKLQPATKLLWVDSFGMHSSCWMDFGECHTYRPEQGKELLDPITLTPNIPVSQMYDIPLHLAVNRFHKQTPPPSLVKHKTLLAYVDHIQQWPKNLDTEDFVKYIRETWLPATSPDLLENPLFQPEALKELAMQGTAELIPVCSVLGGMVGNEIIKAISGKGAPANNTVLFDGTTCKGWYFLLQEKKK
eukprot:CAMPEP_0198143626 /NCGR_PEP_ID=MMETSP1443-20131203/8577_1 /TAXON_ID=186043 /ORGANISM="Entomoneis sp., Strain CCMP2396" /LENGTH=346 /DNA_ID=CAMNT_0043806889 /DNA_START=51 /DNA_END=1091 /DNA_ORIENTATION=-